MSAAQSIAGLRRRITLEAPAETADDNGGAAITFVTLATLWARISDTGGALVWRADQQGQCVTQDVVFRARNDVTAAMRFRIGTRILQITAIQFVDEKQRWMKARCEEVKP